jgi:hypothetical protein
MDLSKLTKADKIIFGSGIVFLVSMFLDWFSIGDGRFSAGLTGMDLQFFWGPLPFLIVVAMLGWIGVRTFAPAVKLPIQIAQLYLAGAVSVPALVVLKFLIGQRGWSRAFGLFVAMVAAVAFGFGAFLKFTEQGGDIDAVKAQLKAKADELSDKAKPD